MSGSWRWLMEIQWLVFWGAWAVITWFIITRTENSGASDLPPLPPRKTDKKPPSFVRDAYREGDDQ